MADQPIDVTGRPSMISVRCGGDECAEWIVVDQAFTGTGYCSTCLRTHLGTGGAAIVVEPPPEWFAAHNPVPPPADYPPSTVEATKIRVADPDLAARCLNHPDTDGGVPIALYSLNPDDIWLALTGHDRTVHDPGAWLIGGPGGADGDICNPCGGGGRDKRPLVSEDADGKLIEGPRHDLCLRGNPRGGWGRNCPCTHHEPYMRGIKPGDRDIPGAVKRTRDLLAEHNPPTPPPTPPPVAYLWDPEEDTDPDE